MKSIGEIIRIMAMGAAFAFGLAGNIQAQLNPPPQNTNSVPSTNSINWAVIAAAQQADYASNYAAWVIPEIGSSSSQISASVGNQAQQVNQLLVLSSNLATVHVAQFIAASNTAAQNGMPLRWTNTSGDIFLFDHTNADGSASVKMTCNLESVQTVGAQKLWPGGSSGYGLSGSNVLIAEWDAGDMLTNHQEFTNSNRASLLFGPSGYGVQDHATHVAGTLAAYGVSSSAIGFANRAKVAQADNQNDFSEMPQVVSQYAVRESNHSYARGAGWVGQMNSHGGTYYTWYGNTSIDPNMSYFFGFYDDYAQTTDLIIYQALTYLPVFAAGNFNGYAPPPSGTFFYVQVQASGSYIIGSSSIPGPNSTNSGYNTLSGYAVSKNAIAVGAVNQNTSGYTGTNATRIASFSSLGPTADGRVKPDVVADGVNVTSTLASSTTAYGTMSGTSMAAPAVTGTLGLITALYQKLYTTNAAPLLSGTNAPLASTLRGILIHTADPLGPNAGPNYTYGWGLLDAVAAANIVSNNYASQSVSNIKEVQLVSGDYIQFPVVLTNTKPFKATIVWTDPPGTPTAPALNPTNHMLINDLDLRVISAGGVTNYPWILDRKNPAKAATNGDNDVDNVEQVYIPKPTNGVYQVTVHHKGNLVDNNGNLSFQNVSILTSGNIVQPPAAPKIAAISTLTTTNLVALKWASDVGRVYKVQANSSLTSTNWYDATVELSATKTNLAAVIYVGGLNTQFYRVVQVR